MTDPLDTQEFHEICTAYREMAYGQAFLAALQAYCRKACAQQYAGGVLGVKAEIVRALGRCDVTPAAKTTP